MEGNVLEPARLRDAQNRRWRGGSKVAVSMTVVKGWAQWFNSPTYTNSLA